MKQADYEEFCERKKRDAEAQKTVDKQGLERSLAEERSRVEAENQRKQVVPAKQLLRDGLKQVLIDQIVAKNQKATSASLRFPEVGCPDLRASRSSTRKT